MGSWARPTSVLLWVALCTGCDEADSTTSDAGVDAARAASDAAGERDAPAEAGRDGLADALATEDAIGLRLAPDATPDEDASATAADGSGTDASTLDAASLDAAPPGPSDAGGDAVVAEAGPPDGGPPDSGPADGGPPDTGPGDAGAASATGFVFQFNMPRPANSVSFGRAVAISADGTTLVIGDNHGAADGRGAATVYTRRAGSWSAGTALGRPAGAPTGFGWTVALSADGSTLVVGNPNGSTATYARTGGTWSAPTASFGRGHSVALSADGNTLAVGDPGGGGDASGSATIYLRTAGVWGPGTAVVRPVGATDFGQSVTLSADGNTLAVGDRAFGSTGAAYAYTQSGGSWSPGVSIPPPTLSAGFGWSVTLSADGNTLVVGDVLGGVDATGAATAYTRTAGIWSAGSPIAAPLNVVQFGWTAALSPDGTTLVVGSLGIVAVYSRTGGVWSRGTELDPPPGAVMYGDFGMSVSLPADFRTLVIGDDEGGGDRLGAASIYTR